MTRPRSLAPAYTLVELMVVVSVLTIIVSITLAKIGSLIARANESSTRSALGSLRGALAVYYADNESLYPSDLGPFLTPGSRWETAALPLHTRAHGAEGSVSYLGAPDGALDTGGLAYVSDRENAHWGFLWVACTHTDSREAVWSRY